MDVPVHTSSVWKGQLADERDASPGGPDLIARCGSGRENPGAVADRDDYVLIISVRRFRGGGVAVDEG